MRNGYGTRLPRSCELSRMSQNAGHLVILAHRNALISELAGLEVGFCWNRNITIDRALRSVEDRFRGLNRRAEEFNLDLYPNNSLDDLDDLRIKVSAQRRA